jgi:uncharacterized protein
LIYFDASAILKFIKAEAESHALRTWRAALPHDEELVTSSLAGVEIARTLVRAGVDPDRIPTVTAAALQGLYVMDLTSTVLARATRYPTRRLGSLDAIHLASADPFATDLRAFVTYDAELAAAAADRGLPVVRPS